MLYKCDHNWCSSKEITYILHVLKEKAQRKAVAEAFFLKKMSKLQNLKMEGAFSLHIRYSEK